MMLRNVLYFFRNALRFKGTFFINMLGLASGLACALLIYRWASDEWSIDRFHEHDARLYRVMYNEKTPDALKTSAQTPYFLHEALKEDLSAVDETVVATPPGFFPEFVLANNQRKVKAVGKFAGKEFFNIFSYPIIAGNTNNVLDDNQSVVISESLAHSLFNTADVVGNTISYQLIGLDKTVTISGVFADVPANASERFDFVLPFGAFRALMGATEVTYNWDKTEPFQTFVLLNDDADALQVNAALQKYIAAKNPASPFTAFIARYTDGYLYGTYHNGQPAGGRIEYVKLFGAIALFILGIACINFVNLSTARASTRLKHIGVKKVSGATRLTLVGESLLETLCLATLAVVVALGVVQVVLPQFNVITGKTLTLDITAPLVLAVVLLVLGTTLLAGIYPAVYLSRFDAVAVLKGKVTTPRGELWVRKGLVVFQYAVSMLLIVAVTVIYQQIDFVQSKNLGYDRANLLYFDAGPVAANVDVLLDEAKKIPGITHASSMLGSVVAGSGSGMAGSMEYGGREVIVNSVAVNFGLLETIGVTMAEGRSFSRDLDAQGGRSRIILNETAERALGGSMLGKTIGDKEVIGIVKDFHFQSLHEQVHPLAFRLEPETPTTIWVRVEAGKTRDAIAYLQSLYSKHNPDLPFHYTFADDANRAQYVAEYRVSVLAKYFTALAIVISSLGVLGLAAFTAERRQKEIAIRKVLGSTAVSMVYLLSKEFTRLVLLGVAVGMPLSYYITAQWLQSFAYSIDLAWWYFAGGGAAALLITWVTIGSLTVRAAQANPTDYLKYE